jgi:TPR repeat protein
MRGSSHRSPELIAWYEIRDTLLGENHFKQDIKKALQRAAVCQHPDAVWLTNLFSGCDVKTPEEARQVFLGCEDDARAICFAGLIGHQADKVLLRRAAKKDCAYAQAWMAGKTAGEEIFRWAQKSAAQVERGGFYMLAFCYRFGQGCELSVESAKENYLAAAELGDFAGLHEYILLLDKNDPQRFVWLGRAAPHLGAFAFLEETKEQMMNFKAGMVKASLVFAIGRALKGHVDVNKRLIFEVAYGYDYHIRPAKQAFHFYNFQLQSYRRAVDCWTLVGIRNGVVKDVRKMIGEMIWDAREEARYELNCEIGCRCPFCDVT